MSENRLRIKLDTMPVGYESLNALEVVRTKNDSSNDGALEENTRFNGILTLGEDKDIVRRVPIPDIGEMWGYDPEDRMRYNADPEAWEREQELNREVQELKERIRKLEDIVASGKDESKSKARMTEDKTDPANRNFLRKRWDRVSGKIGSVIVGAHASVITSNLADRSAEGEVIVVDQEKTRDGYIDSERRTGKVAIGAVAVAAAGVVGAYLLGSHTGHNVTNNFYNQVPSGSGGGASHIVSQTGEHTQLFGSRDTGVMLPKNLSLRKVNGHFNIVDSNGKTVVGHLWSGIADKFGNLSKPARAILRSKGYKLYQGDVQGGISGHFATIVENH